MAEYLGIVKKLGNFNNFYPKVRVENGKIVPLTEEELDELTEGKIKNIYLNVRSFESDEFEGLFPAESVIWISMDEEDLEPYNNTKTAK